MDTKIIKDNKLCNKLPAEGILHQETIPTSFVPYKEKQEEPRPIELVT